MKSTFLTSLNFGKLPGRICHQIIGHWIFLDIISWTLSCTCAVYKTVPGLMQIAQLIFHKKKFNMCYKAQLSKFFALQCVSSKNQPVQHACISRTSSVVIVGRLHHQYFSSILSHSKMLTWSIKWDPHSSIYLIFSDSSLFHKTIIWNEGIGYEKWLILLKKRKKWV